jgi:hypothetical protein
VWTKDEHRICDLCKADFAEIHDTIAQVFFLSIKNDMQWNRDTRMSKEWLENMYISILNLRKKALQK